VSTHGASVVRQNTCTILDAPVLNDCQKGYLDLEVTLRKLSDVTVLVYDYHTGSNDTDGTSPGSSQKR